MADDKEVWRQKFLDYYATNAPEKVEMVTDAMMDKWEGKYEKLFTGMKSKYGEPGHPIVPAPKPKAKPKPKGTGAGGRLTLEDCRSHFEELIAAATPASAGAGGEGAEEASVVEAKALNAANGIETSSFTVCTRIRPMFEPEHAENYVAVVPGRVSGSDTEHTEQALVFTPKLSIRGDPKIEKADFQFDYCFGPEASNAAIYGKVGAPLASRAMAGQVGVAFAYGQTSTGKTHTMNGLMDGLVTDLFRDDGTTVTFSYLEVLGAELKDCMQQQAEEDKAPMVGEMQDGSVAVLHLSEHLAQTPDQLGEMIEFAKACRTTASTERNDSSSRSHGIAIMKVDRGVGCRPGVLYVIDLAGSERAADSKDHSKERMDETKAINTSLMNLKACIRARTDASSQSNVFVPYRRSKLTLLMKDVFDVGCSRMCSTVVICCVSPLARDIAHSTNTLQYAAPLRVAVNAKKKPQELDPKDPALWNQQQTLEWLSTICAGIDPAQLLSNMDGRALCLMPEPELCQSVQLQLPGDEGIALGTAISSALWTMIVDAKTRRRRPDGTIVTEAQEAEEIRLNDEKQAAKVALWAEREKQLQSELSFGDDGLSTG